MNFLKKIVFLIFFFNSSTQVLYAESPYFLDFKFILNESTAGKKAQTFLKNKLENGIKNIKNKQKEIQEEEKKIIQKKKIISAEEYEKNVKQLRNKVSSLQKERNQLLETVAQQRQKARKVLLDNLNPIIKNYMKEKKIRMVVDKKSLLLADEALDITQDIISILNTKLKSINLK
tara:strand:- start:245 stop:769 length:525 start_codon:yes stop_codon:yes gene_type:complete